MADHEEQVISTESEPRIEVFDEVQPDGTILRKKRTTRTITKRVLTSTNSSTSVSSSSNERIQTSASSTAQEVSQQGTIESKASSEHKESKETKEKVSEESTGGRSEEASGTTEQSSTTRRSFKYRIFGEGDSSQHPLYRFLARFPLKELPAPHTRRRPVKAIMYAYAPGWTTGQGSPAEPSQPAIGSFDVDSLKWMVYLKFNRIDFQVKPAFEPAMSPSGKLPFLALPSGKYVTSDGFEEWVQENRQPSAAAQLDLHESAEAVAFITLAESKIHAALFYTLWFESAHFNTTTRQHYFGHHNWILAILLSYLEKSNVANSMLLTRTQIDRELIFEEAATAIEALAIQLGKDEYFFGKSEPSSLDAVTFSYLHVILTLPKVRNAEDAGRSGELARIVRKHENLYRYSQNIWKTWFT
ncbi:hypothetical protein BC939DRAFT_504608 [Gamsiella multidivaricata]|uniref:uncharacterized protein n=1 Tax=Gamsiella multidivaricata TaxID=101098 RepID=UPI002220CC01|nr:uncharacterized protein BC939DRAFT_504608 [Gamsiella multidivaricata]KAG0367284.1 hypothetical protein BGZ54_004112 [Gamsiella multidivaricata]KAI7821065.1 hypothetical protein BC939DRAFT_504608 [Gamsiella multidivaricata]